jgi:hypothetical protein
MLVIQDTAVVVLDAFYHIYVWVGSKAPENLKLIAPKLVAVFPPSSPSRARDCPVLVGADSRTSGIVDVLGQEPTQDVSRAFGPGRS